MPKGILFYVTQERDVDPEGSDFGTRMRVPRSVRRENDSLNHFLFPPHPFFCIFEYFAV